jgi:VWFA-related protein
VAAKAAPAAKAVVVPAAVDVAAAPSSITLALALLALAPQTPQFRTTSDIVVVDAQVIGRDGQPITTLGAEQFQVTIDGRPRRVITAQLVTYRAATPASPVAETAPAPAPAAPSLTAPGRTFLLAVDGLSFDVALSRGVAHAAQGFVDRLQPEDRAGVFAFPLGPKVDPTTDRAAVTTALQQVTGQRQTLGGRYHVRFADVVDYAAESRGASSGRNVIAQYCNNTPVAPNRSASTSTDVDCATSLGMELTAAAQFYEGQAAVTFGMLESLCRALAGVPGRKTVVLVSAGLPVSDRPGGRPDVGDWPSRLGRAAAEANVNLYTLYLDTQYLSRFAAENRQGAKNLNDVTRDSNLGARWLEEFTDTAGGAFQRILTGNAETSFDRVLRETSSYYLLGVEPIDADRDGRAHEIRVKTSQRNATVRSRQVVVIAPRGR